jgi:hypothetical protein
VADTESIGEADSTLDHRRWDLRGDGWPKQPTTEQVRIARKWIRRQFDKICDECGFRALPEGEGEIQSLELASTSQRPEDLAKELTCPLLPGILRSPRSSVDQQTLKRLLPFFDAKGLERGGYSVTGISPTSQDAIVERAIRSLYDWRATLNLLAELKNCVAYNILQIISNRLGLFQLGYADLLPARLKKEHRDLPARLKEERRKMGKPQEINPKQLEIAIDQKVTASWNEHIKFLVDHYFSIVPGKWVIALFGRKGPGGCAGWDEESFWDDEQYGTDKKAGDFPPFVKALCELGFHVIYAPYSKALQDQHSGKDKKLLEVLQQQFDVVQLTDLDKPAYPDAISIHPQKSLELWFAPSQGGIPQGSFPGEIVHQCVWPDSLKFADFDSSTERLFENWISSHANRHSAPPSLFAQGVTLVRRSRRIRVSPWLAVCRRTSLSEENE